MGSTSGAGARSVAINGSGAPCRCQTAYPVIRVERQGVQRRRRHAAISSLICLYARCHLRPVIPPDRDRSGVYLTPARVSN
jgi:hypothetical protein